MGETLLLIQKDNWLAEMNKLERLGFCIFSRHEVTLFRRARHIRINTSASPAILRNGVTTDKRLLVVDKQSPVLDNFQIFLAISERAFKEEWFFFMTRARDYATWHIPEKPSPALGTGLINTHARYCNAAAIIDRKAGAFCISLVS